MLHNLFQEKAVMAVGPMGGSKLKAHMDQVWYYWSIVESGNFLLRELCKHELERQMLEKLIFFL